jgi:predicted TIM-barrel enzyme
MSIIAQAVGSDLSDDLREWNAPTEAKEKHRRRSAKYVPIDMQHMMEIYDFYMRQEPEIKNANDLKTAYSQAGGARLTFAGKELDPVKFPIVDALMNLAARAREYRDMFGFVAVYNPGVQLDHALQSSKEEDDGVEQRGVTGNIDKLTQETWDLLNRIAPERARDLYNKVTETVPVDTTGSLARVITLPRTSTLHAPSAVLDLADEPAVARAETQDRPQRAKAKARTLERTLLDLGELRIVSLHDGFFYVEHDEATMINRVVFSRKKLSTNSPSSDQIEIDPSVYVFVWPGRMPERDGRIKTDFDEVWRLRRQMDEAQALLTQVNYELANPTLLVEREVPKHLTDTDSMTDQQIYGGGALGSNPTQEQLMMAKATQSLVLRAAANESNARQQTHLEKLIAKFGRHGSQRNGMGEAVQSAGTRRIDFCDLPQFMRVGNQGVQPSTIIDVGYLRNLYRAALSDALGMTVSMRDGGTSFSSRQTKTAASGGVVASASEAGKAMADSRLHMMVIQDREAMRLFVNSLYDAAYRETDTQTFIELLAQETTRTRREIQAKLDTLLNIETELNTATQIAQNDSLVQKAMTQTQIITALNVRLREIESRVRSLITLSFRFEIHFSGLSHLSSAELNEMVNVGALDHLEYANALRVKSGLGKLTDAELLKNAAKRRKITELLEPEEKEEKPKKPAS